ncbi:MAG: radical SAM protein [Patescibacteria group bacterium]
MYLPVGTGCNLRCKYCYFHDQYQIEQANPQIYAQILESMTALEPYRILISGGECTLAGIDFFRKIVAIWEQSPSHDNVRHCILTNGKVVDEAWVDVFVQLEAETSLSIDLPLALTEEYRNISAKHLLGVVDMLRERSLVYKITSVVTTSALQRIDEIVKQAAMFNDAKRLSLTACFDGSHQDELQVDVDEYLQFLRKVSEKLGKRLKEIDFQGSEYLCPVRYECEGFVFVEASGKVYLCAGYSAPYDQLEAGMFLWNSPSEFDINEFRKRKQEAFLGQYDCRFNRETVREFMKKFHHGGTK